MTSEDPLDRFCEEALVGRPRSSWPVGLPGRLARVFEEAVLQRNDFGSRFADRVEEDSTRAMEWACREGELGRWAIPALATTPHLNLEEKRRFLCRLLPWVKKKEEKSRFASPVRYYQGVDFLVGRGEELKRWFPYLLLPTHPEDVELALAMVRRAVEDPSLPDPWSAFLMMRLPVIFRRTQSQKRFRSLRNCADAFFESSVSEEAKDLVRRSIGRTSRGVRDGVAFPVPPELAREVPAFRQMERELRRWSKQEGPDLWARVKIADERLYPSGEDWLPYREALERSTARTQGSKGVARAITKTSDARRLNALVEPFLETAEPLSREVEQALRAQMLAHDPALRASAVDALLAYGSDPVGDSDRALTDRAEQVRRAPLRTAISGVKMARLPDERRRILLAFVRDRRDSFVFSKKQASSFARWVQMIGLGPPGVARPATESRPSTLDSWMESPGPAVAEQDGHRTGGGESTNATGPGHGDGD
jgi:hypothetical protein